MVGRWTAARILNRALSIRRNRKELAKRITDGSSELFLREMENGIGVADEMCVELKIEKGSWILVVFPVSYTSVILWYT